MDASYAACTGHTASEIIDGEAVVINFDTNRYYGFNTSATFVWSLLSPGPTTADAATDALAEAFQRSSAEVRDDVRALLATLVAEGLAEPARGDAIVTEANPPASPYTTPRVERYGTLEQLMLAGE